MPAVPDAFVAEFNADGDLRSDIRLGGKGRDLALGLATDDRGADFLETV